jgi:hypothetical protein
VPKPGVRGKKEASFDGLRLDERRPDKQDGDECKQTVKCDREAMFVSYFRR